MWLRRRLPVLAISLAALSSMASGYYNWVFFPSRNGPFNPIPAKIDRNTLPNGAVSYFISDQPPGPMVAGDSFASLVSEIRAAAEVWNQVPSSSLRLAFGGMETVGAISQNTPAIDVVFDDNMPPGLLAQTRPTVPDDLSFLTPGSGFVPILRSRIQLRRDLTAYEQASYYDSVFLTIVHEFGHALGLQHTMTAGVMSTALLRATTKAAPLSADDVAGVSMLYPAPGYVGGTGAITGAVLLNGGGVNLASVVALSTSGVVISGMTNPDGTYRIGGVPPGQYYVYAHPLPPPQQGEAYPANIIPPEDAQKNPFPAVTGFDTEFFPGTHDWTQAGVVTVNARGSTDGINFNMQPRSSEAIYNMLTYGYQGQVPVPSPPLRTGSRSYLVFSAPGATTGGRLAAGLGLSAVGGAAQIEGATLQYYQNSYGYVVVDAGAASSATPVALAVTLPNDLYVLPAAFSVVPSAPPVISGVSGNIDAQGNATVIVAGANLGAGTRVVFDGVPGSVAAVNADGSLTVAAPSATAGYTAFVEALTSDGQTSLQGLGSAAPPTFTYPAPANAAISVNSGLLLPGADSLVDIIGVNTSFADGQTVVGLGNSDVSVRRVWVLNPNRVLLNVSVSPSAQPGSVSLTVASGLQLVALGNVLQVQTANPRQMSMRVPVINQLTGLAGVPAGGLALINSSNLPQNLATWTLTVDGVKTASSMGGGNQIYVQVPPGLPLGAAVVQLTSPNNDLIPPVVMQIDAPPPVIQAAENAAGVPIDNSNPVRAGDSVILVVSGLTQPSGAPVPASSIRINVGGADQSLANMLPGSQTGQFQLQFTLNGNAPFGPQQDVTVQVDTRRSAPYRIAILPQ